MFERKFSNVVRKSIAARNIVSKESWANSVWRSVSAHLLTSITTHIRVPWGLRQMVTPSSGRIPDRTHPACHINQYWEFVWFLTRPSCSLVTNRVYGLHSKFAEKLELSVAYVWKVSIISEFLTTFCSKANHIRNTWRNTETDYFLDLACLPLSVVKPESGDSSRCSRHEPELELKIDHSLNAKIILL